VPGTPGRARGAPAAGTRLLDRLGDERMWLWGFLFAMLAAMWLALAGFA
jgi:hypothetical protein